MGTSAMSTSESGKRMKKSVLQVVIAGGTGIGKSTVVKALTDNENVIVGGDMNGVTKKITDFTFKIPGTEIEVQVRDVPGVGDFDMRPAQVFKMYEDNIKNIDVDAVILFLRGDEPRFDMVAQFTVSVMDICFKERELEKFDSFVVLGTRKDKCEKHDIEAFYDKDNPRGVYQLIGKQIPGAKPGYMCMTSPDDMSELHRVLIQIAEKGSSLGKYTQPDIQDLIRVQCKVTGIDEKEAMACFAKEALAMVGETSSQNEGMFKMLLDLKDQVSNVQNLGEVPPVPVCSIM